MIGLSMMVLFVMEFVNMRAKISLFARITRQARKLFVATNIPKHNILSSRITREPEIVQDQPLIFKQSPHKTVFLWLARLFAYFCSAYN